MPDPNPRAHFPYVVGVLAMTADGKIGSANRAPAQFGSAEDRAHLLRQVARADAVLFGGGTLRAHGNALLVRGEALLAGRRDRAQTPQPIQIACSRAAEFDPDMQFFRQDAPRWLLTTAAGRDRWGPEQFEQVLVAEIAGTIDWPQALQQLVDLGLEYVVALGGGEVMAGLLACDAIAELWLTVCPLLLGGARAPTPIAGLGRSEARAKRLELLSAQTVGEEIFLHYRVPPEPTPPEDLH